ncbi:Acetyl-CoA synthetase (ADP-forming) alpha and beta chain, putative [Labilithrix luteola]|uniref:Acetyl-CoA synthetase (ADP-forming) alpha and beta chain, putative n=1 Tax=Labilithrix luteola TaxID=1391654 RepID=A0A0K1PQ16_9BACT|nr:Acetyl-CoA synthetase (ADP-forming) alpha and beta chain, putative [Labilithrix luteola]
MPVVLRDGGSLLVRALRADDGPRILELFHRLSADSIRHRAFMAKTELTPSEVHYLTNIDFVRHVALAAVLREDGAEHIIGVGRYCSSAEGDGAGQRAEVAFSVADEHQGRGIGTLLLEHLARIARSAGIEELEADVMADNARMLSVFAESGFPVRESMASGIYRVTFPTSESEAFVQASLKRERKAAAESVRVFFEPTSVAVIGASRRPNTIGGAILDNLRKAGFRGRIYPINPNAKEIRGLPAFPSIRAVGQPVDLAIIAVPARDVEETIAECARLRVRGVVVISSGFAETGSTGAQVQQRLRTLVRSSGMRMVGPNCMGVLNANPEFSLDATFAPTWPPAGNVSMLSQSGALGIAMLDQAARLNVGLSCFVSVGNKADVSGNDLLSYWADDPTTEVIALYLESFGNPRKFARIAPAVARRKPIVAVKSGRSTAGTRAAASHSAALANVDVCVDALFAQAGVLRTTTLEDLFDLVSLLSTQPLPRGPRVGVVTNAGGPGILLADACEAQGLKLPELEPKTIERLQAFLPKDAGLSNPIDMIASATADQYARAIEVVANDPNVDALVVIYIPPLVTTAEDVAAAVASAAGSVPNDKPIATVFMSTKGAPPILSTGRRGKIPSYSYPENVALALSSAVRYARWRERPRGTVVSLDRERRVSIRREIERVTTGRPAPFWAPPDVVARLMEDADIPMAKLVVAAPTSDAAVAAARDIGYPVVAKAVANGLVHKSDVGGVILGLDSDEAVRAAVEALAGRVEAAGYELSGVALQRQYSGGVEAIVGVTMDPSFGPLIVAGLGGVQVELMRDVAFRLTPVSDLDAAEMIDGLRGAKLLDGFRGAPVADRASLLDVIQKISAFADVVPELLEFEINPLVVLPRGEGAIGLDVRMRLNGHGV